MKLITAVIKPDKLDEVKDAVKEVGIGGMTIADVKGFGAQGGVTKQWRGADYTDDMLPKTEIKMVVDDVRVTTVLDAIVRSARTGSVGDGKIWVTEVDTVIRIRTGEQDLASL